MSNKIVLDLETKNSFEEVGGRENLEKLGVSLVGIYNYKDDEFLTFEENELSELEKLLKKADEIIGFNIKSFDFPVLQSYFSNLNLLEIPNTDLMESVEKFLGYRVSLDNIAKATLKKQKSGKGLDAIKWYRNGELETLKKYCLDDVRLTRGIYEYGLENGHILLNLHEFNPLFTDEPLKDEYAIPADWARKIETNILRNILDEAYRGGLFVKIDYVSSTAHEDEEFRKERVIEIQELEAKSFKAYCFLRKAERAFKINRILSANIV